MKSIKIAKKTVIQGIKFIVIGVLNTLVDLGLLNILLFLTGVTSGAWFSLFKTISYSAGIITSFICNKRWTFNVTSASVKGEIGKFLVTSAIALAVNVATATTLGTIIGPQFGIPEVPWVNISALFATGVASALNFISYKFLVFKVQEEKGEYQAGSSSSSGL